MPSPAMDRRKSWGTTALATLLPEDHDRVAVQSEERIVTFHLGDGSLGNNQLSWRLGRLIGGDEVIRDSAPDHVLGETTNTGATGS